MTHLLENESQPKSAVLITKPQHDLVLRPHHVTGFASHEMQPHLYDLPDADYIRFFRETVRIRAEEDVRRYGYGEADIQAAGEYGYNFHSDALILHWRAIIRRLHENPDLRFRYATSLDTVCESCDKKEGCRPTGQAYQVVQSADEVAIAVLPELEQGKIYDGRFLRRLFEQKGWLKEQTPTH